MKKIFKKACKISANIFAVAFGLLMTTSVIANDNATMVSKLLGAKTTETITKDDGGQTDTIYHKSKYESIAELKRDSAKLIEDIVAEGSVLLKNDGALPLSEGADVSLFGSGSVNFVHVGGGSSYSPKAEKVNLKNGLERAGFKINSSLWNWYSAHPEYSGMHTSNTSANGANYAVNDASWDEIDTNAKTQKSDAAIFVISRYGTEATDVPLKGDTNDLTNGNYMALSPKERDVLKNLKEQKAAGVFGKIIVLMNSAVQIECDFLEDSDLEIDALLWVGETGSTGTYAIGDLLSGKVNPSGKVTDTVWKQHLYNPVYANWPTEPDKDDTRGDFKYADSAGAPSKSTKYVVYQEGIYNGYRYVESRYEDIVLGNDESDFDYTKVVSYPFGYGLSYTEFEYSDFTVTPSKGKYTVSLKVTNVGDVAGKEVVQVYLQKPYTEYDKLNGIEKASVELVGYAKTDILEKNGGNQTVSIEVDEKYFASYDAKTEKTYIVDAGAYYLTAASDAHAAVNNILFKKGMGESEDLVGTGSADFVYETEKQFDAETYSKSKATKNDITNQFDGADINIYDGQTNTVKYISRSDWEGTVKLGFSADGRYTKLDNNVKLTMTEFMKADAEKISPVPDDSAYPEYNADNGITLAMLRAFDDGDNDVSNDKPVPYEHELWDKLLDQLSWEETVMLLSNALRSTAGIAGKINKPLTIDGNGALGPVNAYDEDTRNETALNRFSVLSDDPDKSSTPYQYPCNSLLGSTFNDELVEDLGEIIGEDCLWAGYSGLYGPGANVHRGAYNGRAFEYYSEDGFLSGKICAAEVRGIQSKGVYAYVKHALLNEMESNREGVCTWANEQTIREIYLRPFEIAIEEGGAYNVMTSFNRIGMVWSGAHGFCNTVLRDEFGMKGFAVSDYWQKSYMTLAAGILGGNDIPDGTTASGMGVDAIAAASELNKYKSGYGQFAWAMRESAHRILYVVAQSNALNGFDSDTRIILITPWWQTLLLSLNIVFGIALGASVIGYAVLEYLEKCGRKTSDSSVAGNGDENEKSD